MLDVMGLLQAAKIDTHCHIWPGAEVEESARRLITAGRMLGITEYWCSAPITEPNGSWADIVKANDAILWAMEAFPDAIRGLCFVIPGYFKAALAEVKRCLDAGMIGVKLYHQYKIQDPAVWPVIELCIEYQVPILMHAGYLTDPATLARQPRISHGADFAAISARYPEALLINAHIGGGGDWEWTIRALRDASPQVYVDVAGSNLDDGQVEYAVEQLGVERVLFATDGTMAGCVGKVLEADLTEEQKQAIFYGNAAKLLALQGKRPLAEGVKGGGKR
ncbi:MAG: amidohydrolase family protein [Limnochordia bacterium]